MTTDIQDALDRSFGTGPAHPPIETQLATGYRALRRRRALAATVTAGVVAIAGTAYGVANSGPAPRTGGEVATSTPSASVAEPIWEGDEPARYVGGELEVRPGVTVHKHLDNPLGYAAPYRSDGLDLTFRGQRTWVLMELTDSATSSAATPSNGWASFGDWVADQVASAQGGQGVSGWPGTMRQTQDGRVVATPGTEVLQRTDDPRLGASFAPPGATTGAALVDNADARSSYFVVWRVIDGVLEVITTPPRDVVGATWDELLTHARAQYASGEGLR